MSRGMNWNRVRQENMQRRADAHQREKRGPRPMRARYKGTCANCRRPVRKGQWIWPFPARHEICGASVDDTPLEDENLSVEEYINRLREATNLR